MVRINRVYTGVGDGGRTSTVDGQTVPKYSVRVEAVAAVDEANVAIGLVLAAVSDLEESAVDVLRRVQNDLFDIGAEMGSTAPDSRLPSVSEKYVKWLEDECDRWNADLPPLKSFVLPSGSDLVVRCHWARVIVRRAEREAWRLHDMEYVNTRGCVYLNRLSDLMFILSRTFSSDSETVWVPGQSA